MKYLLSYDEFTAREKRLRERLENPEYVKRFYQLTEHNVGDERESPYYIQVSISEDEPTLIKEHHAIKSFKSTTNRYFYHPEDTNIPVKAHYHIIPNNSKKELYAVNLDGTAHHQSNRGHVVPKKEAEELRRLGVAIGSDNILEELTTEAEGLLIESLLLPTYSTFILIR